MAIFGCLRVCRLCTFTQPLAKICILFLSELRKGTIFDVHSSDVEEECVGFIGFCSIMMNTCQEFPNMFYLILLVTTSKFTSR